MKSASAEHVKQLDANDFALFGLPERQALERALVDERWKALQGQVHPDRHAAAGAAAQRVAMQWAVRVNEAYQRLKDPLRRATYLCELHGQHLDPHSNTAMPPAFLMQQMHLRESLEEAKTSAAVQALEDEVSAMRRDMLADIERRIDRDADWAGAAELVRALMFIERFASDVDARLEALGQ